MAKTTKFLISWMPDKDATQVLAEAAAIGHVGGTIPIIDGKGRKEDCLIKKIEDTEEGVEVTVEYETLEFDTQRMPIRNF